MPTGAARLGRLMKSPQGLRGLAAAIGASLAALCIALSPVAARDAAAQVDAPALWRAAGLEGSVYLFGSFHLLPADVKWRTPAVESALSQAAVVVFETDFAGTQDPQALIAKYGFLPPGQTLRSLLPASTNAELEKTASELEIPPLSLAPLRPSLAALAFGLQFAIHQGFDPSNGVEQQIITSAKASGKTLGTLETNESQLRVFADLTREQEGELLTVTLRQVRETPKMLGDMLAAYRKGDLAALERTLNTGFDEVWMLERGAAT